MFRTELLVSELASELSDVTSHFSEHGTILSRSAFDACEEEVSRLTASGLTICLLFLLGCDPGIAIRQAAPPQKGINGAYGEKLNVQVSPYRTLAYSSIYAARIKLTNRSEVELTIDRIELITRQGVYRKDDRISHGLPAVLKPNATADVGAWFELKAPLHDTFKSPAQFSVYYHTGTNAKEKMVSTKLISQ